MPTGPLIGIHPIVNAVLALEPRRVLDLGMGTGKWGFLLREQTDFADGRTAPGEWLLEIDGVEGFEPYIGAHQRSVYDQIHIADASKFLQDQDSQTYDVALALEIIEHFEPEAAVEFISEALRVSRICVVSTPKGFYSQEGHANALETHRSWWPPPALKKLAAESGAQVSVSQLRMTNVAILSRVASPPRVAVGRLLDASAYVKDHLVPQRMYYRMLGRTGPSILD